MWSQLHFDVLNVSPDCFGFFCPLLELWSVIIFVRLFPGRGPEGRQQEERQGRGFQERQMSDTVMGRTEWMWMNVFTLWTWRNDRGGRLLVQKTLDRFFFTVPSMWSSLYCCPMDGVCSTKHDGWQVLWQRCTSFLHCCFFNLSQQSYSTLDFLRVWN